jgi:hypothetical protein
LFEDVSAAVEELGIDATVDKVADVGEMAARGIWASPALVIDDEVVLAGVVPSHAQLEALLDEHRSLV